ncbi:MAG: iron-containing alcohol dehydrogenase [Candidatus Cloacimonetes bacterium]|nr:iron-containing alcohol dehydrogenase [Candidatus Cloacimonadota bacterium]
MFNPTRVIFGSNALENSRKYLPALGKKAFIVCGRTSANLSGALAQLLPLLDDLGIRYQVFNEVSENPSVETVFQAAQIFSNSQSDFLIACGGGSPIDATKAISLVAANSVREEQIFDSSFYTKAFPIVAIPTTSGTGSEATPYSVLTLLKSKKKAGFGSELIFPKLAICDPSFSLSLPWNVTLNSGIDALSHLLEGIYSNKRNPLLYPNILSGFELILKNLPILAQDPHNLCARSAMMQAALYGGITIAETSTTLQHSIGYPLTSVYNVPHGLANGIVMKQIMELYYPHVKVELDWLFNKLSLTKRDFFLWLDEFGLDAHLSLEDGFITNRIPEVMTSRNMANNPCSISEKEVDALFRSL